MDAERLVEYNPNLSALTPATRVAYAKFKVANLMQKSHYTENNGDENVTEEDNNASVSDDVCGTKESYDSNPENETSQTDMTKPASTATPRKKTEPSCVAASPSCSSAVPAEVPTQEVSTCTETEPENMANASVNDETSTSHILNTSSSPVKKDFRTRTPIQEEEEEEEEEAEAEAEEEKVEEKEEKEKKEEEEQREDSKEADAKRSDETDGETLEPVTTKAMTVKESPTKTEGKSKITGKTVTGWL
jgi:transient receptor potential cation channel subfamily C